MTETDPAAAPVDEHPADTPATEPNDPAAHDVADDQPHDADADPAAPASPFENAVRELDDAIGELTSEHADDEQVQAVVDKARAVVDAARDYFESAPAAAEHNDTATAGVEPAPDRSDAPVLPDAGDATNGGQVGELDDGAGARFAL